MTGGPAAVRQAPPATAAAGRSLRGRLLVLTLAATAVAVVVTGLVLSGLFREHAQRQFVERLAAEMDQVMAQLEADAQGRPVLDPARLSDPRWTRPRSGLYWQVEPAAPDSGPEASPALLRSRSLWDEALQAPRDALADGMLHVHRLDGPGAQPLLLIERTLRVEGAARPWRVLVAADRAPLEQAARQFDGALAVALGLLLVLLAGGALLQVSVGLAPLRRLRAALAALREGRTQRLDGQFPAEVQPLVDDLNGVLDRHAELVARARAQAGNLAHALKTPLTVLAQSVPPAGPAVAGASDAAGTAGDWTALVQEQVTLARRHIDWHLARSRAAAAQGAVGLRAPLREGAQGLLRVLQKLHDARGLAFDNHIDAGLQFAGEMQDLQEMLGNLLDNACRAARRRIVVDAVQVGDRLSVWVDDDGPGIPAAQQAEALRRGGRLDEREPGSGLGLAIVQELAQLYGGALRLEHGPLGGLRAVLELPAAGGGGRGS